MLGLKLTVLVCAFLFSFVLFILPLFSLQCLLTTALTHHSWYRNQQLKSKKPATIVAAVNGCVSSNLLNKEDEFTQLGSSALSHHIVSLTSTTYGLLNLDPPPPPPSSTTTTTTPPTPPARFTLGSIFPAPLSDHKSLWSEPKPLRSSSDTPKPEIINSWELMSGLDTDSFRFSPLLPKEPKIFPSNKENSNPNFNPKPQKPNPNARLLEKFEMLCPPNGEAKVVIYTTTLRGIRKTFESCNVVRAAVEGFGVSVCERDVSMDVGFREELKELMRGKEKEETVPPRVFVKGRYVGGVEEVTRIIEEGWMGELLEGLPKKKAGDVCEGCGDVRFLPCFSCNGSCKMVMVVKEKAAEETVVVAAAAGQKQGQGQTVVVRCPDCNENGLVLCPICS